MQRQASVCRALKSFLLFLALSLIVVAVAQDKQKRIGEIDFYGYAGLDLDKIRVALPLHEGDAFSDESPDALFDAISGVSRAVKQTTGRAPTDVAPVCCDSRGDYMIYVGLPGKSVRTVVFNPTPKGNLRLPPEVMSLYDQTMEASSAAVKKGLAHEDDSKGYALSTTDATLRAKQLATRAYALSHKCLIRRVLESSVHAQQRIAAAHFWGYARQSKEQIAALVRASRDADDIVRNNAIRALGVLAQSNPKVATRIPAAGFIEMLSSGSWTDRNKAGWLLDTLTTRRAPKLLGLLRSQALESLIEMARWRSTGHAYHARVLLGRIAGIEETRLQRLVETGQVDQIIEALK